jgi:cytochrome c553
VRERLTLLVCALSTFAAAQPLEPPAWAYPMPVPGRKLPEDDGKPRHVPHSKATFTVTQTRDYFFSPDWHPDEHPPMPAIVAQGRKPDVMACGFCHRATGSGGPENANIAGLPFDYLVQQLRDYRSGARTTALPERLPQKLMISGAKMLTDAEIEAAAKYFSATRPRQTIRVVETETIPKPEVVAWKWVDLKIGDREPLGARIIEVPENLEQFELRDTHSTFIAWVPMGSLQRGAELVGGKRPGVPACESCHGKGLKGLTSAPPIAGRSPSYVMRQLYEFKTGARHADTAALMKPVVEKLSLEDLTAVAAYLASLPPGEHLLQPERPGQR